MTTRLTLQENFTAPIVLLKINEYDCSFQRDIHEIFAVFLLFVLHKFSSSAEVELWFTFQLIPFLFRAMAV
jgi:hypothetical protein